MKWTLVRELESKSEIVDFEEAVDFMFPESFKECVEDFNGATPVPCFYDTLSTENRDIESLLSFNRNDTRNIWWAYVMIEHTTNRTLVPFATDKMGNFLCFNRSRQVIWLDKDNVSEDDILNNIINILKDKKVICDE